MKTETAYQAGLINRIKACLPGCVVFKNDPSELQGIPDLLVLFGPYWAMLEVKASRTADIRPNQEHYVDQFNQMSFAAFVYPENEEDVLGALQSAFGVIREARVS